MDSPSSSHSVSIPYTGENERNLDQALVAGRDETNPSRHIIQIHIPPQVNPRGHGLGSTEQGHLIFARVNTAKNRAQMHIDDLIALLDSMGYARHGPPLPLLKEAATTTSPASEARPTSESDARTHQLSVLAHAEALIADLRLENSVLREKLSKKENEVKDAEKLLQAADRRVDLERHMCREIIQEKLASIASIALERRTMARRVILSMRDQMTMRRHYVQLIPHGSEEFEEVARIVDPAFHDLCAIFKIPGRDWEPTE